MAQPASSAPPISDPDHNPWLTASSTSTSAGPSRKRNAAQAMDKATKHLSKSAAAREAALEDERVDIDLNGSSLLKSGKKSKDKRSREEESDGDEDEGMLPNGLKGFKQRDLVAEAFAGDNVVEVSPTSKTNLMSVRELMKTRTSPKRKLDRSRRMHLKWRILRFQDG